MLMGEFKAREESAFQSGRIQAETTVGQPRGPSLDDLKGVIQRNFGGTPFATLAEFTAKTVGIVASNIESTLGNGRFFGEPPNRPMAASITDISRQALAFAQQGQMEKARELIKEADEKLEYALGVMAREKELDASEKAEKGKGDGEKDEVKDALRAAIEDAGTANSGRADLAMAAAEFYAKNQETLSLPEMKEMKRELIVFISSLGNDAKMKAGFNKQEKETEFERIRELAAPVLKHRLESALAVVSEASESAIRMLDQKGVAKEFKKVLEGIRDQSKDLREKLKEGRLVPDDQLRKADAAISYAKEAFASLSKMGQGIRGPASEMFARAIKAIHGGDEKTAGIHDFLAREYPGATSKSRETLAGISASLESGKIKASEALSSAAKYISGILRGRTEGIKDAGILGPLKKILGKLDGGSASVNDLRGGSYASVMAEDYEEDVRALSKNKVAQEGAKAIYGRAFSAVAGGLLSFASRQHALAKLFCKKRMSGARENIEAVSKKADTVGKLRQMHQLIKEGMKPGDAARLCSEGGEDLLGQYMAMADPEAELGAAEQMLDAFIFAAELRSGFAKKTGNDDNGVYKAAVEWLDDVILARIARGEEPSSEEMRALFALAAIHGGGVDGMEQFLLGGEWPPGTMNGVLGIGDALEGLHGEDRVAVEDMLWSAEQALFEGRFEEAAGHMLAASASAALKGRDRKMLEEMSYAVACEGSESAQSLIWVGRAQLDRAALGKDAGKEAGAYFDIAIITFTKGDFNGAQLALSLAKLFGRAEGAGKKDPRAQEARGIVRDILGDCRDIEGRLMFGEGVPPGMAGNEKPLLAGLMAASSAGGETAQWLSQFSGEKKLFALALKIEKSNIELGRAEIGAALLEISDGRYQDIYDGQEDRYLDKAAIAEKTGKPEKARAMREEADRTGSVREKAKESAMAYEAGASMREQEIERMINELRGGGEPTASDPFMNGAIIMSLAEKAMAAEAALHESITSVRTDKKEDGRAELARAAESYLKAASLLESSGFLDAALVAHAGEDAFAGAGKVAAQKAVQREMKKIEQELLGIISGCRAENDKNLEEFGEGGFDTPKRDIYYDDGRVSAGKEGALISHEKREGELKLAEDDAKKHRFDDSAAHISIAKIGIQIDRFRGTVEREYRRMYPEIQGSYWSREASEISEVMEEFGYGAMMTDLFNADRYLGKGNMEAVQELLGGFETRLAVNITAQQLALQELSLRKTSEGFSEMANAAGGFGLDPKLVKESGVDFSLGAKEGFAKMKQFLEYKQLTEPFGWGAHYDNVKAVRANTGAFAIADKAATLKKKADTVIGLLQKEREALRGQEKAGNGAAALEDSQARLGKLAKSGESLNRKYSRFNDGFQIWVSCSATMLSMLDGVDSIEKQRGHEHALKLRYEQIRDDAAVMGQLARIVSDDPIKALKLIESGESVAYKMGSGEYKLRDEYGGYDAATLKFAPRSGSFSEVFEEVTERSLKVAEGIAVGDFGERGRAQEVAGDYTALVMANSGMVEDGAGFRKVKMSAAERGLAANALNGSGGANEMLSLYFSAPATLTSFFSTNEGGNALDAIGKGIADKVSIIEDVTSARVRGEPFDGEALEACAARLKQSGAEAKGQYDAFVKEGLSDESTARGIKAVFELGLSAVLTASGLGSVAGVYSGTMALKDLAFQSDRAGGFGNLSTYDKVMGVTNVALGFADGATKYLGELGKGASQISTGINIAGDGFGVARFDRVAMSFMTGGGAATWSGRILGSASLVTGGIGMYEAAGAYNRGDMNWFEFGVVMLSGSQPVIDHGVAALGKTRLSRLADDSGRGRLGKIAVKTARGVIGVLSGNLVKDDVEAYRVVERMEEHGEAFRRLDGRQKKEYAVTVAKIESAIGRTIDHEEGLFAMSFVRGGNDAESAAIAFIAKPKADRMFELHLRKKAGEDIDDGGLTGDERQFIEGIKNDDNKTAYGKIYARMDADAKGEIRGLQHKDIIYGISQKIELSEQELLRVAEFAEALSLSKDGALNEAAMARLGIDDEQAGFIDTLSGEGVDAVADQMTWLLISEKTGDSIKAIEATVGAGRGSPTLERELRTQLSQTSAALKGLARRTAVIARTIEWLSVAGDAGGSSAHGEGLLRAGCEKDGEYGEALKRIGAAHGAERVSLIVHEAREMAYARMEKGMLAAIGKAGLGEEGAGVAKALFGALLGEPASADMRLLDAQVMDETRESVRNGMEMADAVVEAAAAILEKGKGRSGQERISANAEIDAVYQAVFDDAQRMIEDEIGDMPGSPALESELARQVETVSAGKGEGKASADTVIVARTLERLLMQRESGGGIPADSLEGFCAAYPDYASALKNLEAARPDELPGLIRQEALAIVNARRSQEIEDAIVMAGIGGEAAELARAVFSSIIGEPVKADMSYLDPSVMENALAASGQGKSAAEAAVEAATSIAKAHDDGGEGNAVRGEVLEMKRLEREVDTLGEPKKTPDEGAEVIDIESRRKDDDGPEPPDGPEAQSQAIRRTGTDNKDIPPTLKVIGGEEADRQAVLGSIGKFWGGGKNEGGKAGAEGQSGQVVSSGQNDSSAASPRPPSATGSGAQTQLLPPSMVALSGTLNDVRAAPVKESHEFESLTGDTIRVSDAPRASLVGHIGSGAGCEVYSGRMVIGGELKEVAVKVLQVSKEEGTDILTWEGRMQKAKEELALLKIGSMLGIGPAPLGFVEVGGNPAIAMEMVHGKPLEDMDASEIRKNVGEGTFASLINGYWKMKNGGFMLDDFQYLVLTEDQRLGGIDRKKGEVVFIDMESLMPLDKSNRFDTFGDKTLDDETANAKKIIAYKFLNDYYSRLPGNSPIKAGIERVLAGVFKRKGFSPDLIARFAKKVKGERVAEVMKYIAGIGDRKDAAALEKALDKAGRESGVGFIETASPHASATAAGGDEKAILAHIARDILLGKAAGSVGLDTLPNVQKAAVSMLMTDEKFVLNAKADDGNFLRFIGNSRTGGGLIGEIIARAKKASGGA